LLEGVHSDVSFYPDDGVGFVCYTNFGAPRLARFVNEDAFDLLMGLTPRQSLNDLMASYEKTIEDNRARLKAACRVANTRPSHRIEEYAGRYCHPAYGEIAIEAHDGELILQFRGITLALEHLHYDAWVARDGDLVAIEGPHPFDRGSPVLFESDRRGEISALSIHLEPAVAPIRFARQ
jgi:hypothetical protein